MLARARASVNTPAPWPSPDNAPRARRGTSPSSRPGPPRRQAIAAATTATTAATAVHRKPDAGPGGGDTNISTSTNAPVTAASIAL